MLLIGSGAAHYHFSEFRQPKDYDVICHVHELSILDNLPNLQLKSDKGGKRIYQFLDGFRVEVEIADALRSSYQLITNEPDTDLCYIDKLKTTVQVASPETLFILKKSHLPFKIHWEKNFFDYYFLKIKISTISKILEKIFELRYQETITRVGYKNKFQKNNDDFFHDNVERIVPHDQIHQWVKFYEQPVFEEIKQDPTKAEVSWELFQKLPYEKQLANLAEEVMTLSLEREIFPRYLENRGFSEKVISSNFMAKMCYNYLPLEFRHFAIDHFYQVLNFIPKGFSQEPLKRMKVYV